MKNKKTSLILIEILPIALAILTLTMGLYVIKSKTSVFENKIAKIIKNEKIYSKIDEILIGNISFIEKKQRINYILNSYNRKNDKKINLPEILEDYIFDSKNLIDSAKNDFNVINILISDYQREKPFSNLTSEQNKIFINLKNSISNKDFLMSNQNIIFLSQLMNRQNNEILTLKKDNDRNFILAIIGLVISVILGFDKIKKIVKHIFQ